MHLILGENLQTLQQVLKNSELSNFVEHLLFGAAFAFSDRNFGRLAMVILMPYTMYTLVNGQKEE